MRRTSDARMRSSCSLIARRRRRSASGESRRSWRGGPGANFSHPRLPTGHPTASSSFGSGAHVTTMRSGIGVNLLPATISPTIRFASELIITSLSCSDAQLNHSGCWPIVCLICPSTRRCQKLWTGDVLRLIPHPAPPAAPSGLVALARSRLPWLIMRIATSQSIAANFR